MMTKQTMLMISVCTDDNDVEANYADDFCCALMIMMSKQIMMMISVLH